MSTYAPPPRPSMNITPGSSTKIRLREDSIATSIGAAAVGLIVGIAIATTVITHTLVNERAAASVPWCTAPIADAGGICHGEPLEACATEDSANCYWDARGTGRSFVDVGGVVYFQDVNP